MIQRGKSIGGNDELDEKGTIARLWDLTINKKIIKKFRLQKALTHAKFYNGAENYSAKK